MFERTGNRTSFVWVVFFNCIRFQAIIDGWLAFMSSLRVFGMRCFCLDTSAVPRNRLVSVLLNLLTFGNLASYI